jgi:O-antigen/teichoic acid export membrane protein
VVRNGAITLVAVAINSVLLLAGVIVLARGLGAEALGQYYTIFAVLTAVQLLTECGISTVLTPRIINARAAWKATVAEAMGLLVVVSFLSAAALCAIGAFWAGWRGEPSLLGPFVLGGIACVGFLAQQFAAGIFRALERFEYESIARVFQNAVAVLLAILFVHRGPYALDAAVGALAVSHVLAALFMLCSLQRGWQCLGMHMSLRAFRSWLAESIPLALGDFVRRFTMQLDTLLLSVLQSSAAVVALYNLAFSPMKGLALLPRLLLMVTFPAFVRLAAGKREVMARAFATSMRLLWVTSLPFAVVVCLLAEPIALLLGGPEFIAAAPAIRILIWTLILIVLSTQFRLVLTALGQQRLYVVLVLGLLVIGAGLEVVLILWAGYLGLCTAVLLGEIFYVAAGLALCHYLGLRGIEWGRLARAALGAAAMAGLLWLALAWPLPLFGAAALVATVCYFLYCYSVGALLPEEGNRLCAAGRAIIWRLRGRPSAPSEASDVPEVGQAAALGLWAADPSRREEPEPAEVVADPRPRRPEGL